jgi:hypothetical protein
MRVIANGMLMICLGMCLAGLMLLPPQKVEATWTPPGPCDLGTVVPSSERARICGGMPSDVGGFEPLRLHVDPRREAEYFAAILMVFGIIFTAVNAGLNFRADAK